MATSKTENPTLHSLVIVLSLREETPNEAEQKAIEKFEDELDDQLFLASENAKYFGRYEGKDLLESEMRLFVSAPNVDQLVDKLENWLRTLSWSGGYNVVKRYGSIHDAEAEEKVILNE